VVINAGCLRLVPQDEADTTCSPASKNCEIQSTPEAAAQDAIRCVLAIANEWSTESILLASHAFRLALCDALKVMGWANALTTGPAIVAVRHSGGLGAAVPAAGYIAGQGFRYHSTGSLQRPVPYGFRRKRRSSYTALRGRSFGYCHLGHRIQSAAFPSKTRPRRVIQRFFKQVDYGDRQEDNPKQTAPGLPHALRLWAMQPQTDLYHTQ